MQSFSSSPPGHRPRLLVVELWGLGDVAMAVPFLRAAARHADVTLLAKQHATPLVQRFCPEVEHIAFNAPWTAFRGKYRMHAWPWREIAAGLGALRKRRFSTAVSARPDPRDHALMLAAGAKARVGFPRAGSRIFLNTALARPAGQHRFAHWQAVAEAFGWNLPAPNPVPRTGRQVVIHLGAAQPTRQWGREHFGEIARRLRQTGWQVTMLDDQSGHLENLMHTLAAADRFIGNDSGPGHLAALLGVPTFTVFGSYPAEQFHPLHPQAAWIDGAPCPYKPCQDYCRFAEPHCIRSVTVDETWTRIGNWLAQAPSTER